MRQQEANDKTSGTDGKIIEAHQKILKKFLDMVVQGQEDSVIKSKVKEIVRTEMGPLENNDPKAISAAQDYWKDKVDNGLRTPWPRFFILYDPKTSLRKVTCPVLAIAGDKDLNVPPDENFPAIESALKEGKNRDYTLKILPNLGHGLGEPEVRTIIGDWIEKHTK